MSASPALSLTARIARTPGLPPRVAALALARQRLVQKLDQAEAARALDALLADDEGAAALVAGLCLHAPFLQRIARQHPDWLLGLLTGDPDALFESLVSGILPAARDSVSLEKAMADLRATRQHLALLIAAADLAGVWDVDRVTAALSAFADRAVDAAFRLALREAQRLGRLAGDGAFERPGEAGIAILAMGKHGAGELNYSSDIDLIVVAEPDRLPVAGNREPLDEAIRVIKDVVRVLHEQTGVGYVFRTDLRLRPDPGSNPIVLPVERALVYYETVGQNWERAALIKARAVAGDIALGERCLKQLTPFVWRRYFDYASIADIHAMKRQIHVHKGHESIAIEGHDVKLGRGGIREIEFFVQTQQLVFGGKRPQLRGRRTLDMLAALQADGWISPKARDELSEAYRFLRMVEHRIQMQEDQQTQRLPKDKAGIDSIAGLMAMKPAAFRTTLTRHLKRVEGHYARLFEDAPDLASPKGNLVFTGVEDDPETLKTLRRLGYRKPEAVAETVRGWHFGRRPAIVTPRAREVLTELQPALVEAFGKASDPDGALFALDEALQRMPAVVELFTILLRNRSLLTLFAEMLGSAPALSDTIVQRPHVLDVLVDPEFGRPADPATVAARVTRRLGQPASYEDFLDAARDATGAERFLVGARLLSGITPPEEAGPAYAATAEAVVVASLARAAGELERRHGRVPGAACGVVALGKLGGRELTPRSDLDLFVIYDLAEPSAESDGERPLFASEWFSRLAQRLQSALTVPTRRGHLYEVDFRLRPSGSKGPLAVALPAFEAYHAGESETWEAMSLCRARTLSPDAAFAGRVDAALRRALARPRDPAGTRREAARMRSLISQEKPARSAFDLKLAPGGFVDIEFVAQTLTVQNACTFPDAIATNTGDSLARLAAAGLLAPADAATLDAAWRLQTGLAQVSALVGDAVLDPETMTEAARRRMASLVGLPSFKALAATLAEQQAAAHAIHRRIVG
jgi:glutamate-ammonia-ligase adenylyltransferase